MAERLGSITMTLDSEVLANAFTKKEADFTVDVSRHPDEVHMELVTNQSNKIVGFVVIYDYDAYFSFMKNDDKPMKKFEEVLQLAEAYAELTEEGHVFFDERLRGLLKSWRTA